MEQAIHAHRDPEEFAPAIDRRLPSGTIVWTGPRPSFIPAVPAAPAATRPPPSTPRHLGLTDLGPVQDAPGTLARSAKSRAIGELTAI